MNFRNNSNNELKWGKNSNFKCVFGWLERIKSIFFEIFSSLQVSSSGGHPLEKMSKNVDFSLWGKQHSPSLSKVHKLLLIFKLYSFYKYEFLMNNIHYSHARLSTNMKNYFWKKVVNIKKKSIVKMAAFFMFNIGGWWWQERQNCINENCHIYYYYIT